nr:ABC transporter ATP-binding protein [uncultured Romboutsia sp.]
MKKTTINLKNITKIIQGNEIIKNVNLDFESGNIYGIVGGNGCGKSILLKVISGLSNPTQGTISINKTTLKKGDFPQNMGILINTPGLLLEYSAIQNLTFLASINKKISINDIRNTLDLVGLNPEDKRKIKNYSLGMKQKVGIAQAIMENPDIIILDEPMNALDEKSVNNIRKIILDLKNKGKLIIITSHNKEDINILCDYIYKIDNGQIQEVN